jgi:hypothetical protein
VLAFLTAVLLMQVCPQTVLPQIGPAPRLPLEQDQPETVLVAAAAWDMRLRNVPIQVCGYLIDATGHQEGQALAANGAYLMVERAANQPAFGTGVCILCVVYRRDGLSEAEQRAAGLPERVVVHGPSPDYVLYRCKDLEDCKELARTGPRGRTQISEHPNK